MKLDFNIETVEGRKKYINDWLENNTPTPRELEQMADYLIFASNIEKRGALLTANRMVTVNKRETSMEGLTEKLEGGESAFHALIKEDKNTILTHKTEITQKDLDDIPDLKQLREAIDDWAPRVEKMEGLDKYRARKMLIEMRKDQYAIKAAYRKPMYAQGFTQGSTVYNFYSDTGYELPDGTWHEVSKNTIDLWNPRHVSQILANYSAIVQETAEDLESDLKWMIYDLDNMIEKALADEPVLKQILISKIDKLSNEEIQKILTEEYGVTHSQEYISSLYRNKIPELIVDKIKEEWVNYVYLVHLKGEYKQCSRCGEIKLAMNRYFSINRTSSSKFYSICKICRNGSKK